MRSRLLLECPQTPVYFYNSFSLRLTENLHEQKHDLHVLFISFFSKMYNNENYLPPYGPLT